MLKSECRRPDGGRRRFFRGLPLTFAIDGCGPSIQQRATDLQVPPSPASNPAKVILGVFGVFSALLILLYILEGNDLSFGN